MHSKNLILIFFSITIVNKAKINKTGDWVSCQANREHKTLIYNLTTEDAYSFDCHQPGPFPDEYAWSYEKLCDPSEKNCLDIPKRNFTNSMCTSRKKFPPKGGEYYVGENNNSINLEPRYKWHNNTSILWCPTRFNFNYNFSDETLNQFWLHCDCRRKSYALALNNIERRMLLDETKKSIENINNIKNESYYYYYEESAEESINNNLNDDIIKEKSDIKTDIQKYWDILFNLHPKQDRTVNNGSKIELDFLSGEQFCIVPYNFITFHHKTKKPKLNNITEDQRYDACIDYPWPKKLHRSDRYDALNKIKKKLDESNINYIMSSGWCPTEIVNGVITKGAPCSSHYYEYDIPDDDSITPPPSKGTVPSSTPSPTTAMPTKSPTNLPTVGNITKSPLSSLPTTIPTPSPTTIVYKSIDGIIFLGFANDYNLINSRRRILNGTKNSDLLNKNNTNFNETSLKDVNDGIRCLMWESIFSPSARQMLYKRYVELIGEPILKHQNNDFDASELIAKLTLLECGTPENSEIPVPTKVEEDKFNRPDSVLEQTSNSFINNESSNDNTFLSSRDSDLRLINNYTIGDNDGDNDDGSINDGNSINDNEEKELKNRLEQSKPKEELQENIKKVAKVCVFKFSLVLNSNKREVAPTPKPTIAPSPTTVPIILPPKNITNSSSPSASPTSERRILQEEENNSNNSKSPTFLPTTIIPPTTKTPTQLLTDITITFDEYLFQLFSNTDSPWYNLELAYQQNEDIFMLNPNWLHDNNGSNLVFQKENYDFSNVTLLYAKWYNESNTTILTRSNELVDDDIERVCPFFDIEVLQTKAPTTTKSVVVDNHVPSIVAGSIVAGLILIGIIVFFVMRARRQEKSKLLLQQPQEDSFGGFLKSYKSSSGSSHTSSRKNIMMMGIGSQPAYGSSGNINSSNYMANSSSNSGFKLIEDFSSDSQISNKFHHRLVSRFSSGQSSEGESARNALMEGLKINCDELFLVGVIGTGAKGRIFKATYCGSDVAVKELFPKPLSGVKRRSSYKIGSRYSSTATTETKYSSSTAAVLTPHVYSISNTNTDVTKDNAIVSIDRSITCNNDNDTNNYSNNSNHVTTPPPITAKILLKEPSASSITSSSSIKSNVDENKFNNSDKLKGGLPPLGPQSENLKKQKRPRVLRYQSSAPASSSRNTNLREKSSSSASSSSSSSTSLHLSNAFDDFQSASTKSTGGFSSNHSANSNSSNSNIRTATYNYDNVKNDCTNHMHKRNNSLNSNTSTCNGLISNIQNNEIEGGLNDIFSEIEKLRKLRHPNIIQLFGCAGSISTDTGGERFLLVMELAACSLLDLILMNQKSQNLSFTDFTLNRRISVSRQVASGCAYMHENGIIHFDIKPENILLDSSGSAKICDLGIAKYTSEALDAKSCGTPAFMAPELLHDNKLITTKVDVYSFGILLWQILHLRPTHPKKWTIARLFFEVRNNKYRPPLLSKNTKKEMNDNQTTGGWSESTSPTISVFNQKITTNKPMPEPELIDLLKKCWNESSDERPDFLTIIAKLDDFASKIDAKRNLKQIDSVFYINDSVGVWNYRTSKYMPATIIGVDNENKNVNVRLITNSTVSYDDCNNNNFVNNSLVNNSEDNEDKILYDVPFVELSSRKNIQGAYTDLLRSITGLAILHNANKNGKSKVKRKTDWKTPLRLQLPKNMRLSSNSNYHSKALHTRNEANGFLGLNASSTNTFMLSNSILKLQDYNIKETGMMNSSSHIDWAVAGVPIKDTLIRIAELGKGASGSVFSAIHVPTFHIIAVKEIHFSNRGSRHQAIRELNALYKNLGVTENNKKHTHNNSYGAIEEKNLTTREKEVVEDKSELERCPYIVWLHEAYYNIDTQCVCLVMEHCDGGSLQDLMDRMKNIGRIDKAGIDCMEGINKNGKLKEGEINISSSASTTTTNSSTNKWRRGFINKRIRNPMNRLRSRHSSDDNSNSNYTSTESFALETTDEQKNKNINSYNKKNTTELGQKKVSLSSSKHSPASVAIVEDFKVVATNTKEKNTDYSNKINNNINGSNNNNDDNYNNNSSCSTQVLSSRYGLTENNVELDFIEKSNRSGGMYLSTGVCFEESLALMARSLLKALKYLHGKNYVHLDIKPANILINRKGEVKLADFGLARQLEAAGQHFASTFVGSIKYMSPLRLHGEKYSYPSDIFSFGLTMLSVTMGHYPEEILFKQKFKNKNDNLDSSNTENKNFQDNSSDSDNATMSNGTHSNIEGDSIEGEDIKGSAMYWKLLERWNSGQPVEIPERIIHKSYDPVTKQIFSEIVTFSKEFRNFLSQALDLDPSQRSTASVLLQHDWLRCFPEEETKAGERPVELAQTMENSRSLLQDISNNIIQKAKSSNQIRDLMMIDLSESFKGKSSDAKIIIDMKKVSTLSEELRLPYLVVLRSFELAAENNNVQVKFEE